MGSLPHPHPAPHPSVPVGTGVNGHGHRSVTVKVGKGGIPAGDTMILAFTGNPRHGTALGAGGITTGPAPRSTACRPRRPVGAAAALARWNRKRGYGPPSRLWTGLWTGLWTIRWTAARAPGITRPSMWKSCSYP